MGIYWKCLADTSPKDAHNMRKCKNYDWLNLNTVSIYDFLVDSVRVIIKSNKLPSCYAMAMAKPSDKWMIFQTTILDCPVGSPGFMNANYNNEYLLHLHSTRNVTMS